MGKHYRSRRRADDPLSVAINRESKITAAWYARISGQIPWKDGERELYAGMTAKIEQEIHSLSRSDDASWFASLPEE